MVTVRCLLGLLIMYISVTGTLSLNTTTFFSENKLTAIDDVGVLTSPGYPNNFRSMNCTWIIEASNESAVVYVKVLRSSIGNLFYCGHDSVSAYDGPSTNSSLLIKWCGTQTPNMTTTGRYLTLHFLSSGSLEGFNLTFQQKTNDSGTCGEDLTAESVSKELTSPGYPSTYRRNLNCKWSINAYYYSYNIKLVAVNTDIEMSYSCAHDSVMVYDGSSTSSRLLGKFCGTQTPSFVSTSSSMTVTFTTDASSGRGGFRLSYQSGHFRGAQCSYSSLTAYSYSPQYLISPGYPQDYSNNLDCKWSITATSTSHKIKLIVTDANIESSSSCSYDSVKVYNGPSIYSSVLGTFCGSQKPTYVTSGSHVTVTFKTDGSDVFGGFKMSYQSGHFSDPQTCGTTRLSAFSSIKYFTSPGYPNNYGSNLNCKWIISTYAYNIKLVAVSSDIESSVNCIHDSVKVYDGSTTYSRRLGNFCGTQKPSFVSTSSSMTVTFTTDASTGRGGFRLSYQSGHFSAAQCSPSSLTAYSYSQYLSSPGYPQDYSNNLDCQWSITATSSSYNIKLIVTDSKIEWSASCSDDSVKVFDGPNIYSNVLGTFCGSQKPTFVSSGNHVTVTFKTDGSTVAGGFKMSYRSERFSVCDSEELTSYMSTNQISSPFYPLQYPNDADCTWTINTYDSDFVVYIEITYLDIEGDGSHCYSDYLQVVDDRYGYGTSLGRWCGSNIPSSQHSSGQYMFIKFHSDGNTKKTGFDLQYSSKDISSFKQKSVTGAVIGGIAAGVVVIVVIACFASHRMRKSRRTPEQRSARNNQARRAAAPPIPQQMVYVVGSGSPITTMVPTSFSVPSAPATFAPPPSYNEVLANDQENQTEVPPPPYNSLGIMSEAPKAVTGDACSITRPDTHPIIPRETVPHTYQGQDNRAGPTAETP